MLLKIILLTFFISLNSFAFKLTPMKAEFSEAGKKTTQSFRVVNSTDQKIKVEAEILTREIDELNNEKRNETEHFTIYPPQLEVEPGKSKVIRATYIGPKVDREEAYRLVVRQFPNVNVKKEPGAQINILFEYVASLYVSKKEMKPNLIVDKCIKLNNQIELQFRNSGTKHSLLKEYNLELVQGKKKKLIKFDELSYKEMATQNILAGLRRKLFLPDSEFSSGVIKAKFIKK